MVTGIKLNPKETIARAYELISQKESWILESTTSSDTSQPQSKLIARVFSQDYQFEIFGSNGQILMKLVCIGDDKYFFSGSWEKSKREKDDNLDEIREYFANPLESIKNAEFISEEQIDGIVASVYQFDFDFDLVIRKSSFRKLSNKTSNIEYKVKIWIDNKNLPVKIESNRKDKNSKGIKTENRVEKFKFDEIVKIEAPKI